MPYQATFALSAMRRKRELSVLRSRQAMQRRGDQSGALRQQGCGTSAPVRSSAPLPATSAIATRVPIQSP